MVTRILSNRDLQIKSRMICYAMAGIIDSHLKVLKKSKTQEGSARWAASMANMAWVTELAQTASNLNNATVLQRLGIVLPGQQTAVDVGGSETCELFFNLTVNMMASRSWSLVQYCLPPDQFAGVLDSDGASAHRSMQKIRATCELVVKVRYKISEGHPNCEAKCCDTKCQFIVLGLFRFWRLVFIFTIMLSVWFGPPGLKESIVRSLV
jgi:hypothetical protein